MPRERFSAEQILCILRDAEALLGLGKTTGDVHRSVGVTGQTYHCWWKEYGGVGSGKPAA